MKTLSFVVVVFAGVIVGVFVTVLTVKRSSIPDGSAARFVVVILIGCVESSRLLSLHACVVDVKLCS